MNRWLAGNVVWPLTERMLGRDTMRRFRTLMETDTAPALSLANIQAHKLRRLLTLVEQHCPFYRDRFRAAGLDVRDPGLTAGALRSLPLLERADVTNHLRELTWHDCPGGPPQPYNTGGSTGSPLKFYIDRCRQAADWAARWRTRSWWNIHPGDREIMLWAGPLNRTRHDRLRNLRDHMLNQFILDAFNMSDETMNAYATRIREFRPRLLYGYASSLALLARHMLGKGDVLTPDESPRVIFVTGETVVPQDSGDIQNAFGCPVVVEYGARDCGLMACGCPAGRLHVNEENIIVEVLDSQGQPVGPGEVGEVVITSLESFATPMIRYRVGDIAVLPADVDEQPHRRCTCGRASLQLAEVRGRVTDQIVCRSGHGVRRMHALSLIYVLREAEGMRQFRIVQTSVNRLDIEVVTDQRFTPEVERSVVEGLRRRMAGDTEIRIVRCNNIAPTASGKHACVVSQVELNSI